jgi:hypothetical protein
MFHLLGVTPEAATPEQATGGNPDRIEVVSVDAELLKGVLKDLCDNEPGEKVSAFCAGTPHFSYREFERLAGRVKGRKAQQGVEVLISTSREISGRLDTEDWAEALWAFGVKIVVDTCTYLTPVALNGDGIVVTNSAKWAHYAPGNINRRSALMSLDRCIRCAENGKIVA